MEREKLVNLQHFPNTVFTKRKSIAMLIFLSKNADETSDMKEGSVYSFLMFSWHIINGKYQ